MAYKAIVKANIANPNSRFSEGTLVLENLGGTMPVHIKEDGSKSTVFPVHPGIQKNAGFEGAGEYLVVFARSEKEVTYTSQSRGEVTEYQMRVVTAKKLDALQLDDLLDKEKYATKINVGINAEHDPATEPAAKNAESALG